MPNAELNLDRTIAFDPTGDFDAFLKSTPAKWVVYLMSDEAHRPVQLLCVKNLRYSLKRRLGLEELTETSGPSRKIDYRAIVRHISWRRVDSTFESDVVYFEAARRAFPQTYSAMAGLRPAWFLHVNPDASFPRYIKTTDLSIRTGDLIGPVENRSAANKLIEEIADWFDLCRYYHILVEAPHGKACAYKEMGKCPAPCDGSISMEQYRRLIEWSARVVVDPAEMRREQIARMRAAAESLHFEAAAKIKTYIESLSVLGKGALRHVRRLADFNFLSLQPCGQHDGCARAFLVTPGHIEEIAGVPIAPFRPADLVRLALNRAAERRATTVDVVGTQRIGLVTHHLFSPKANSGIFLPLDAIREADVVKAHRELQKTGAPEETESEGVVRELES